MGLRQTNLPGLLVSFAEPSAASANGASTDLHHAHARQRGQAVGAPTDQAHCRKNFSPAECNRTGSGWWRAVNCRPLQTSTEARLCPAR